MKQSLYALVLFLCGMICAATVPARTSQRSADRREFPVVVVGGGPAGLSCAAECAKMGFSTLLCDSEKKNLFAPDVPVTNWPGLPAIGWKKVIETFRKDCHDHGVEIRSTAVRSVIKNFRRFLVSTDAGTYQAKAVVIATGRHPPATNIPIVKTSPTRICSRLWDGHFLTSKDTVLITGNSEQALGMAIQAAVRAKQVDLFIRAPWRSTGSVYERTLRSLPNVSWVDDTYVTSIIGSKDLVTVECRKAGGKLIKQVSWMVFGDDWIPASELAQGLARNDSSGSIITVDETGITATAGLFACGEVASKGLLLGVEAAADGARTGRHVCQFLLESGVSPTRSTQQ